MIMLLQVSPETLALNLLLIIGAVVLLGAAFIVFITAWTGINSMVWLVRRRRAERVYRKSTFRADGVRYPAFLEGVCSQCRRGGRKIYYPPGTDKELCPQCYERDWRRDTAQEQWHTNRQLQH